MSSLSSSKAMLNSSRALRSKPSSSSSILPSSTLPTLQSTRSFHLTATRSSSSTPPSESKPKTKTSLLSPLSPSAPPPSSKPYSPLTISFVKGLARLMGYNSTTSTAIRVSSDLYDRCSERGDVERKFWYAECSFPPTYQTWFQVTNLHVWLLLIRFRSLPSNLASQYSQELINHFFIDAESRMRERFGVQTARLVKGYMKDMHMQQRGSILGLDEALANLNDDGKLATALWRNLWGGGWGEVEGVKRKIKGIDKTMEGEDPNEEGEPELAKDMGAFSIENNPYAKAVEIEKRDISIKSRGSEIQDATERAKEASNLPKENPMIEEFPDLAFPAHLERLTKFVRKEIERLANISDEDIMRGRIGGDGNGDEVSKRGKSIAAFERI